MIASRSLGADRGRDQNRTTNPALTSPCMNPLLCTLIAQPPEQNTVPLEFSAVKIPLASSRKPT
jgi:hypothetical protein